MAITPLTVSSSSLFGDVSLNDLTSLQTRALTNVTNTVTAKQETINKQLEDRQVGLSAESERLVSVKSSALNAKYAYENAADAMNNVQNILLEMRNYTASSATDYDYSRENFDAQWSAINSEVNAYSKEYNPIGNVDDSDWTPNVIEYKEDTSANMVKLQGTFAGADFKIVANDGTVWRPDDGSTILNKIDSEGNKDDSVLVSMGTGIELLSYDSATGAISVQITPSAEDPPILVSGTLERGGLEVMPSWFYRSADSIANGLPAMSTDEDRAMAWADLDAAGLKADVAEVTVDNGSGLIQNSINKIDALINQNTEEQKNAMVKNMQQLNDLQVEVQRQYEMMATNLQQASEIQQRYAQIFASTAARNPFFDSLT